MNKTIHYLENQELVGQPGSKHSLLTPSLLLDLDILEDNIESMAVFAKNKNIALRPHAKTHKSTKISQLQINSGALGICCATLGEAEVMILGGINGVLITSPIIQDAKIRKLSQLNNSTESLMVCVDDMQNLKNIDSIMSNSDKTLDIVIDIDVGLQRTGVKEVNTIVELATYASLSNKLNFSGIQAYGGHLQHINLFDDRKKAVVNDLQTLSSIYKILTNKGFEPEIISGGGTGTHNIDIELNLFNELQVGSYIFMDVDYLKIQSPEPTWKYKPSLTVLASVISANQNGFVTTDAGLKSFATDGPLPVIKDGAPTGSEYDFFGDEHGKLTLGQTNAPLRPGNKIELIVPHCDPTVNLYDVYHCTRGDKLVDIWPIDARGKH